MLTAPKGGWGGGGGKSLATSGVHTASLLPICIEIVPSQHNLTSHISSSVCTQIRLQPFLSYPNKAKILLFV